MMVELLIWHCDLLQTNIDYLYQKSSKVKIKAYESAKIYFIICILNSWLHANALMTNVDKENTSNKHKKDLVKIVAFISSSLSY